MKKVNVYFQPVNKNNLKDVSQIARDLLEKLIKEEKISLGKEIPLKIHPGEPGNISYIKSESYDGVINYLKENNIKTYFIETNTVSGRRTNEASHLKSVKEHRFTRIPFVIADGKDGEDHVEVLVTGGKHFQKALIGRILAEQKQIIVLSHFKGHVATGFGAAIKMLGIGFASRKGKMIQHCRDYTDSQKTINWGTNKLFDSKNLCERICEYALAAVNNKQYIYLTFALNLVKNCDCDGMPMKPIYKDLGIFASIDPVAIDKAVFDMLALREGKKPFDDYDIFQYAEKIGLGSQKYKLYSFRTRVSSPL